MRVSYELFESVLAMLGFDLEEVRRKYWIK